MHQLLIIFIHQYMVDVKNNATRKNLNNLTKQMFVHNIQFVNNTFFKQFAYCVFECCNFVKYLSFLLYIASDTEQSNVMHSLTTS